MSFQATDKGSVSYEFIPNTLFSSFVPSSALLALSGMNKFD